MRERSRDARGSARGGPAAAPPAAEARRARGSAPGRCGARCAWSRDRAGRAPAELPRRPLALLDLLLERGLAPAGVLHQERETPHREAGKGVEEPDEGTAPARYGHHWSRLVEH